jgi:hypothetical protein
VKLNPFLDLLVVITAPFLPSILCLIIAEGMKLRSDRRPINALGGTLSGFGIWLLTVWAAWKVFYHGEAFFVAVLAIAAALPILLLTSVFEFYRQARSRERSK